MLIRSRAVKIWFFLEKTYFSSYVRNMLWFTIYCKYHDWITTYLTLTLCSLSVFSNFQWSSVVASHIRDTFFKLFQLPTIGHVVFIWKSQIHWAESVERFGICRNWVRLPGAPMTRLRLRNICGISLGKFQYNNFISGTTVHLSAKALAPEFLRSHGTAPAPHNWLCGILWGKVELDDLNLWKNHGTYNRR